MFHLDKVSVSSASPSYYLLLVVRKLPFTHVSFTRGQKTSFTHACQMFDAGGASFLRSANLHVKRMEFAMNAFISLHRTHKVEKFGYEA
jgi:hypothetical protein